jgi:uncharacterized protein (DUF4415 family)
MSKTSKTDWKRLDQLKDEQIDTSDIPELSDEFFARAQLYVPPKQAVTMRLDVDVLNWFKAQGQGYQTRINKLLRAYMLEHQRRHACQAIRRSLAQRAIDAGAPVKARLSHDRSQAADSTSMIFRS